ncbi:MAG TPA: rhodanese-like domain-containing protein [Chitinivibrionales bacterium]|jgi:rhodanese-related sulfurtransferase|nr:rhodanese-like domain-containing protein [Chitinivibrionales bacterium]
MKILIACAVILLVAVGISLYRRKSMERLFRLPQGEILVIDVRSKQEYDAGHFSTAINIPHDQIAGRIKEFEPYRHKQIVVYCHSGNRSAIAVSVLRQNGFENVANAGGYDAIKRFDTK